MINMKHILKMALLTLLTWSQLPGGAQLPVQYKVQPQKKSYNSFRNPLIKTTKLDVLIVNGEAYLDGDIYVGKEADLDRMQNIKAGFSVTTDNNIITARWENGIIPFTIDNSFSDAEEMIILNAMNHIAGMTNVCFQRRNGQFQYIKFKKYTVDQLGFEGGSSWLGRCGFCTDGQEIKLSFVDDRVVRHEIGHALGLVHEQNREDRNGFIQVISQNIDPVFLTQFMQSPYTTTDVGSYDFNSIMHYHFSAFGKEVNGKPLQTMKRLSNPSDINFGTTKVYSSGDVQGVNGMYPVPKPCATLAPMLPGEFNVGETKSFTISANKLFNGTGVYIRAGQKFQFTTSNGSWNNGNRATDCNGYEGNILDAARRHPDLKMMTMVGEIFTENNATAYTGTYFNIGCGKTWTATKTGFLVCIANDIAIAYADNSGTVSLNVKRIE